MKRPEIEKLYNIVFENLANALEKTNATKSVITSKITSDYLDGLDPDPSDKEDLRETANATAVLMNAAIALGQEVHKVEKKGKIFCEITINGVKYTCPESKLSNIAPVKAPSPAKNPEFDMDKLMYGDDEEENKVNSSTESITPVEAQAPAVPSQAQNQNAYEEAIAPFDDEENEDSEVAVQTQEQPGEADEIKEEAKEEAKETVNKLSPFDEDFDNASSEEDVTPVEAVEEDVAEDNTDNNISSILPFDEDEDEVSETPTEESVEKPMNEVPINETIEESFVEENAFSDDTETEESSREEEFKDITPFSEDDEFDASFSEESSELVQDKEDSPFGDDEDIFEEEPTETPVTETAQAPVAPSAPVSKAFTAGGEVDSELEGRFIETRKLPQELFIFENYKLSLFRKGSVHTQEMSATIAPLVPYDPQKPIEEQLFVPIVFAAYLDGGYFVASSFQTIEAGKNILLAEVADYSFICRGGYKQEADGRIRFRAQIADFSEAKDVQITPIQKKSYPEEGITQPATNGHLRFVQVVPDAKGPQQYVIHAIPFDMNSNDFIIVAHGPVFTDLLLCENRVGVNGQRLTAYVGSNANVNIDCNWYDTSEREFDYAEVTVKES